MYVLGQAGTAVAEGGIDCCGQIPAAGSSRVRHVQSPLAEIVWKITVKACLANEALVPSSEAGLG